MLLRRWTASRSALRLVGARHASVMACVLCDEDTQDFTQHCASDRHVARFAVCQSLVAPDKHQAMMHALWEHLRLDFDAVDGINADKVAKRRRRLSSTLTYLVERNTLLRSIPVRRDGVWRTHRDFSKLDMVGRAHCRRSICDRVARLFPKMAAAELRAVTDFILSPWHLDTHHDVLGLTTAVLQANQLQDDAAVKASQEAGAQLRVATLYAVVGELSVATSQTRPTAVAGREAADGLVLTVLATHALENMVSEVLHHVLQKIVEECTPVWKDFKQSLAASAMVTTRPAPPPLAPTRTASPKADVTVADADVTTDASCVWFRAESDEGSKAALRSSGFSPKCQWTDVIRAGALDVTVAVNPAKGASFATAPKLAAKPKTKA